MHSPLIRRLSFGVALAAASVFANTSPALASAPYNGVCGDGYNVVNSAAIPGGTVYLTYNNDNGENCVVVIREDVGAEMPMDAVLKAGSQAEWERDPGEWTTYAGPVYLEAAGECVDWGGTIGDEWVVRNGTNCG
ncbi:spore-associated protein A [Nocardiopsis sp. HNM0947]|uniref:Spore-associated protein A n=1 Tax=Nocardiopsis coralli TaxID=2772213 RepID=A0ABR9P4Q8_9ACTN|nr:spore-associated protein A [Nocardiopsis coralli]MBE2998825.1 spore-associated protein A [Nocardiopsis coralli]